MMVAVTMTMAAIKVVTKIKIRFLLIGLVKISGRKLLVRDFIKPEFRHDKDSIKGGYTPFFYKKKFIKKISVS